MFCQIGFRCNIWRVGNCVFLELENVQSSNLQKQGYGWRLLWEPVADVLFFWGRCYPSGIKVFQALEADMIAILLEQVIIARF